MFHGKQHNVTEQNFSVIYYKDERKKFDYPNLLGLRRHMFLGRILSERLWITESLDNYERELVFGDHKLNRFR